MPVQDIVEPKCQHISSTVVKTNNNTSLDNDVIKNTKYPDKPDIHIVNYYNYKIRSLNINGIEMYIASDLSNQYTQLNNKKKILLADFLRLDKTKHIIDKLCKIHNLHKNTVDNDEKYRYGSFHIYTKDQKDPNNDTNISLNEDTSYVIQMYSFAGYDLEIASQAYVMCEQLLFQFLSWFNIDFAIEISNFLEQLRHQDNDFLKKNLEIVEIENNELKLMNSKQVNLIKDINSKNEELVSKNNELTIVNTQLDKSNSELHKVNKTLYTEKNKLQLVLEDKDNAIEDLKEIMADVEDKCKDLEEKNKELDSKNQSLIVLNNDIDKAKQELEALLAEKQKLINQLLPRQVKDTSNTNWLLYFTKRTIVNVNNVLMIYISFGYRNHKRLSESIKTQMFCAIQHCPNGQVSRQDISKTIYNSMKLFGGNDCKCNDFYNTLEFKLQDFATEESYNENKDNIIECIESQDNESLEIFMEYIVPKPSIMKQIIQVCNNLIERNGWFNSCIKLI